MNALTQVERDLAELVLEQFDAGSLQHYWPAANGIENSNYFVTTDAGDYVLTVLEQPPAAGEGYIALLQALTASGLPVPCPLVALNGSVWVSVAGKPGLLQPRLAGTHVDNPTHAQLRAIGRYCARAHIAAARVASGLQPYPRDNAWLATKAELVRPHLPFGEADRLSDAITAISSTTARDDWQRLPAGAVHGDLFRDNVLFNNGALSGVLDFHHASYGKLIYDLAVVCNDWCTDDNGELHRDRVEAVLKAYNAERPLTQAELWLFPVACLYAATAFWLSRQASAVEARSRTGLRLKNPKEFARIVAAHLREPCHIERCSLAG